MDNRATRAVDNADLVMRELRAQIEHQDRLATLGTATALIVHEFRNLLTPLRTYAQMALSSPDDPALVTKALSQAVDSAGHAGEIADLILQFAKPESGGHRAVGGSPEEVAEVRQAVDDALRCLVREPAKDGIRLELQIDAAARVGLRPVALQHVLINLLLNARAAMLPRGGTLRIAASMDPGCSTWNRPGRRRDPARLLDQPRTTITIEDNGCGMSASQVRDIFEPFVTRNLGSGGIGLGMAVCKRIVEEAGGRIDVDSAPGRGTRISVSLPSRTTGSLPQRACA